MAREFAASHTTGLAATIYVTIQKVLDVQQWWYLTTPAFENYDSTHYDDAIAAATGYAIAVTEVTGTGDYYANAPVTLPAGTYLITWRVQAGANPVKSADTVIAQEDAFVWSGTEQIFLNGVLLGDGVHGGPDATAEFGGGNASIPSFYVHNDVADGIGMWVEGDSVGLYCVSDNHAIDVDGDLACAGTVILNALTANGTFDFQGAVTATHASNDIQGITVSAIVNGAIAAATFAANALDAVWSSASRTLTAFSDSAGVTTLLSRLTSLRAGYLDYLNIGSGQVASQADVLAINQSASRRVILQTLAQYERPDTGSTLYTIQLRTYDGDGAAVNADSTPTLTATGNVSGNLSGNLSAATNPATGVYQWEYTVADDAVLEQILYGSSATISAAVFTMSALSQVCDFVAATWTTTDAAHLTEIFDMLPDTTYLAGQASPTYTLEDVYNDLIDNISPAVWDVNASAFNTPDTMGAVMNGIGIPDDLGGAGATLAGNLNAIYIRLGSIVLEVTDEFSSPTTTVFDVQSHDLTLENPSTESLTNAILNILGAFVHVSGVVEIEAGVTWRLTISQPLTNAPSVGEIATIVGVVTLTAEQVATAVAEATTVYTAEVKAVKDGDTKDVYMVTWMKNGELCQSGTIDGNPLLYVYDEDGTVLIDGQEMSPTFDDGATFFYEATGAERQTVGTAYDTTAVVDIDGESRQWTQPTGFNAAVV